MILACFVFWLFIICLTAYAYIESKADNGFVMLFAFTCPFWSLPVAIVLTEGAAKLLGV